jgi:hypothetical protein
MLANQFLDAAVTAKNTHAVDEVARLTWRAHAEGQLDDADAVAVSEALQVRRKAFGAGQGLPARKPIVAALRPTRRPPRSPDRQRSLERRRRQAMSGVVPAKIAASFTTGENAVLTIVARQCQQGGACTLPIDAIAALAGVARTTVKRALRQARLVGLLLVRERRIPGRKSLTNIITIVSKEWLGWLKIRGGQMRTTTRDDLFNSAVSRPSSAAQEAMRGVKPQELCRTEVSRPSFIASAKQ